MIVIQEHHGSRNVANILNVIGGIAIVAGFFGAYDSWLWILYGLASGMIFLAIAAIISVLITISKTLQGRIQEEQKKEITSA